MALSDSERSFSLLGYRLCRVQNSSELSLQLTIKSMHWFMEIPAFQGTRLCCWTKRRAELRDTLALMSETRWSSFSALPHLFFPVPTAFQSSAFHLHLLGDVICSTLPRVLPGIQRKVREQKQRTGSRCLRAVLDRMETTLGALGERGWCVLEAWALSSFQNRCSPCGRDTTPDYRGLELKHLLWATCSCLRMISGTPALRTEELQGEDPDHYTSKGPSTQYLSI